MPRRERPPCACRRPLKMGSAPNCGYCGGRIAPPADTLPAADRAIITKLVGGASDVYDPTRHPDVDELPAQTTTMSAQQFQEWVAAPGKIYIVYLPPQRDPAGVKRAGSFVIKVTDDHHDFFVAMVKQLRLALGPAVQAAAAVAVDAPPLPAAADPNLPPPVLASAPLDVAEIAAEPHVHTCPGSGLPPAAATVRADATAGINDRDECSICGRAYQLTAAGNIRLHRAHADDDGGPG